MFTFSRCRKQLFLFVFTTDSTFDDSSTQLKYERLLNATFYSQRDPRQI